MKYLLDSDILIDFLSKKKPGNSFISDLYGKDLKLSVISWCEIMYGIKKVKSKNKDQSFRQILDKLGCKILSIDSQVARLYVTKKLELEKKGKQLADFDLLIASTALANKLTLVTGNLKHFKRISGLRLYQNK